LIYLIQSILTLKLPVNVTSEPGYPLAGVKELIIGVES
jgi:hypothetical protein